MSRTMSTAQNIVISTGAGISAPSGIHTYRDLEGLWTQYDPEEVSHILGWKKNPQKVLDFKNALRRQFATNNYQPNAAHLALVRLQREWRHGRVTVVTQNIDGLHEQAGTKGVLAVHGNGQEKFCMECGHVTPFDQDIVLADACPECGAVGSTRPRVVMFGEIPHHMDHVFELLRECSIFALIGSSLEVQPAASFAYRAKRAGAETYLLNQDRPDVSLAEFNHVVLGNAATIVPQWVDDLLAR